MKALLTASGEKHGAIKQIANSVKDNGFKDMDAKTKAKLEAQRKEDARLVKARYINHQGRHERLTKPYCRYAGDPIVTWHLIPDHVYELPLGFVNEVNNNPGLAQRAEREDPDSKQLSTRDSFFKIHELVPVSF